MSVYLSRPHLGQMPPPLWSLRKPDVLLDPCEVPLLGSIGIVLDAQHLAHVIQQLHGRTLPRARPRQPPFCVLGCPTLIICVHMSPIQRKKKSGIAAETRPPAVLCSGG